MKQTPGRKRTTGAPTGWALVMAVAMVAALAIPAIVVAKVGLTPIKGLGGPT